MLEGLLPQLAPVHRLEAGRVHVALVHQPPGLNDELLPVVEGKGGARGDPEGRRQQQGQGASPPTPWSDHGACAPIGRICQTTTSSCFMANSSPASKSSPVYDWFEERLELQAIADDISSKYVPPHVNIFYCLGGITLVCFLIQFSTGFAMTFYYKPTVAEAYTSVQYLMTDVSFGWLIRSVHRWSASMMVLMLILHVFRVYLTGGFKRPRELTWITGVIMAVITVAFGVTGYSLPWDQVGYWAVKIVSGVPAAVPVVGDFMVELLRGGESVGQSTLTRFYSLHTFVMPWLLAVFMLMHFLMIRKQGISGPL